jgi:hypothetical protein
MENTIKLLAAIGAICGGIGEILRQYNLSKDKIKDGVQEILSQEPRKEEK